MDSIIKFDSFSIVGRNAKFNGNLNKQCDQMHQYYTRTCIILNIGDMLLPANKAFKNITFCFVALL